MPRWKNIYIPGNAYFVTTRVNSYWPIFCDDKYCRIIIENLDYYRKKYDYHLIAYVIMPEHLHFLIHPDEKVPIYDVVRDFKKYTSKQILNELKKNNDKALLKLFASYAQRGCRYSVWRNEYRSLHIYSRKVLKIKINYIHKNPVKRGLVKYPEDYLYSSYRNYYLGDHSVIEVDGHCF